MIAMPHPLPEGYAEAYQAPERGNPFMNQASLSAFIWPVADLLRADYNPADFGSVILRSAVADWLELETA